MMDDDDVEDDDDDVRCKQIPRVDIDDVYRWR